MAHPETTPQQGAAVLSPTMAPNAYPVTPGHSLVIWRGHGADGLALHQPAWNAVVELLKLRREQLGVQDATITGWSGSLIENRGIELR